MNAQVLLEEADVNVPAFDCTEDQVTSVSQSVSSVLGGPRRENQVPIRWMADAVRQFRAIERLPHGWDSQGGEPPDGETVRNGARLLSVMATADPNLSKPRIHPTPSGGIQFHWESGPRYFEIEMVAPLHAQFYYVDSDKQEEIEGKISAGEVVRRILELVRVVDQGT